MKGSTENIRNREERFNEKIRLMKRSPTIRRSAKPARAAEGVQTKLKIGQPGDKHEQQADAVADQVMKMPDDEEKVSRMPVEGSGAGVMMAPDDDESVQMSPEEEGTVQMSPEEESVQMSEDEEVQMSEEESLQMSEEEEESVQMSPEEESVQMSEDEEVQMSEEEESVQMSEDEEVSRKPMIQRSGDGQSVASPGLVNNINSSKGAGRSLPDSVNSEMSRKIGSDFSNVRVHTDSRAQKMNEGLGAKAFAHGNDVYFNKGQYNPGKPEGKHLLAHELTHVVQQKGKVQPSVQRKGGKQKSDKRPFDATIASLEIFDFESTPDKLNITVDLEFKALICGVGADAAFLYSFAVILEDDPVSPKRIVFVDSEKALTGKKQNITLEFSVEKAATHYLKVKIENFPCEKGPKLLEFKGTITRS